MNEDGFRVSVDLQRYFSDERSRAYMNVIRRYPVRWLLERLRTVFGLQGSFCLCSRGHLLPPDEPLSLLQPGDPVEVIPLSDKTLQWEDNKFIENDKETSHDMDTNIPPKFCTELQSTINVPQAAENDVLLQMKEKALAILDTCEGTAPAADVGASAAPGGEKTRRVRRRVRRRKRCLSGDESTGGRVHENGAADLQKKHFAKFFNDDEAATSLTFKKNSMGLPAAETKSSRADVDAAAEGVRSGDESTGGRVHENGAADLHKRLFARTLNDDDAVTSLAFTQNCMGSPAPETKSSRADVDAAAEGVRSGGQRRARLVRSLSPPPPRAASPQPRGSITASDDKH